MKPEQPDDLYALLQVHPKASTDVIKKAYYTLMQKIHPDKGGDTQQAKQLNHAYTILSDPEKRETYDNQRAASLVTMLQHIQQKATSSPEPSPVSKGTPAFTGVQRAPIIIGTYVVVADERGNRVIILDQQGDIAWEYGKGPGEKIVRPTFAQFLNDGHVLVVDAGKKRIIEINSKKELLWSHSYQDCPTPHQLHFQPRFVALLKNGNMLVTDIGNRSVLEIDRQHKIQWEYRGKVNFNLKFWHLLVKPDFFMPVVAFELTNGNILIADQGNARVLEIDRKCNLRWVYPSKKSQRIQGLNFALRLENGHTWIVSDKIIEVNKEGEIVWDYKQLTDSDIKQAYRLEDGTFLIDLVHLVKRGVNQEVLMVNHANKILYRHYYSQYRSI